MPETNYLNNLKSALGAFFQQDMLRRTGQAGDEAQAALKDRELEGALIASFLGPVAPLATVPVGVAGGAYELAKGVAGPYLPGPFRTDETTSPASAGNVAALLKGFSEQATGQRPAGQTQQTDELADLARSLNEAGTHPWGDY